MTRLTKCILFTITHYVLLYKLFCLIFEVKNGVYYCKIFKKLDVYPSLFH